MSGKPDASLSRKLAKRCASSFAAGTLVATPSGQQPIETLEIGDEILCKSETTGLEDTCRVAKTFSRIADRTLEIVLTDGETTEVIRTTAEHPFYSTVGRFTAAGHLGLPDPW